MIKKYKDFVFENNSDGITSEEYELLKKYNIKDYKFNTDTNLIDVFEDVALSNKKLNNLPKIRFGKIEGNFFCMGNKLTSLEYSPREVYGGFYCYKNELTSLEHCPIGISGNLNCSQNELTSLEYCPENIGGNFGCHINKLTSLEYCPKSVGADFNCGENNLSSIEDYPLCIIQRNISEYFYFKKILEIVKKHQDIFENLLDDKIKFHQMVMRFDTDLIKYYTTILPSSNKNVKLLI